MKLQLDYDVTKSTFKYVESLWFRYNLMVQRLKEIEQEGVYRESDSNAGIKGKGKTSDPVASEVMSREHTRQSMQYRTMIEHVEVIEKIYNMLPDEYKKVVRLRYWSSKRAPIWEVIAKKTNYSKQHCHRIRNMVITATAEELGLW